MSQSYSIGNNNSNLLATNLSADTDVNTVKSSNSIWGTIFGTTLPALFQFGGATLANARNARAQENIAQQQMQWYNPMSWGNNGMQPNNNGGGFSWMWIIAIVVILAVVYFIFKALKK